eukprot:scaffold585_cov20-Tisochrysis_lutea.AAC.1
MTHAEDAAPHSQPSKYRAQQGGLCVGFCRGLCGAVISGRGGERGPQKWPLWHPTSGPCTEQAGASVHDPGKGASRRGRREAVAAAVALGRATPVVLWDAAGGGRRVSSRNVRPKTWEVKRVERLGSNDCVTYNMPRGLIEHGVSGRAWLCLLQLIVDGCQFGFKKKSSAAPVAEGWWLSARASECLWSAPPICREAEKQGQHLCFARPTCRADDAALRAPLITAYLTEAYPGPRPPPREKCSVVCSRAGICLGQAPWACCQGCRIPAVPSGSVQSMT